MKFIFKMILTVVLMISAVVILAMTAMTTSSIWEGNFSIPNIMMFIGGLIGASSLIIHSLEVAFSFNNQNKKP